MIIDCDISKLYEVGLSPTAYCYLYYLYKGLDYPFKDTIPLTVISSLEAQDWLKRGPEGIVIRSRFLELIKHKEDTNNVESWIDEYVDLFPKGVYNGGRPIRSSRKNCLKKMKKFVNENKEVTKDDIIEATSIYLMKKQREQYAYTVSSEYFIEKNDSSLLLSIIEDGHARESFRANREAGGSSFHKQI